jgi:predicted ferric reductase
MKLDARLLAIATGLAVFVSLPLLFYALGDAPRRSVLKEILSVATFLSFGFMIGQFFLARSNGALLRLFKPPAVQKVHKAVAYGAIAVIALHPFLIVFPRFFEGGVRPWQAFWTMITSFDNLSILTGEFAWALMIFIGVTARFRLQLLRHFVNRYRGWRAFHGGLAVGFTLLAAWHVITLGRHVDGGMATYFIALIALGLGLLARLYRPQTLAAPARQSLSKGAKS